MKKYLIFTVTVALIIGLYSMNYYWQQPDIPEKVYVSFLETFPSEKYPKWKQEGNRYKASFKISGRERASLFDVEGKLLSYTEEIEKRHIPASILKALEEQFPDSRIEDVFRFHENGTVSYLIDLEKKDKELKLHLDSDGKLLNQQTSPAPVATGIRRTSTLTNASEAQLPPAISLGRPINSWELPSELSEVSGISILPSGKMACVQDEDGVIFIYDLERKSITGKIPFAGNGDYEGLEVVGNNIYVLRSDGVLFEISNYTAAKPAVTTYDSRLARTQDTEGLAYDKSGNRLLIACKGYDKSLNNAKGIYAFSLTNKTFQEAPAITIPLQQKELSATSTKGKKLYDLLQPSSLTVHPLTGELYILDSNNYKIITIDEQGEVQKKVSFSKDLLRQAEGICFSSNGEMYISSEGKKSEKANLVKYGKGI